MGTHEVGEKRVIELNVAAASCVEVSELFPVSLGEIVEVVSLVRVDRVIASVLSMAEVVPFGSGESKLETLRNVLVVRSKQ